MPIHVRAKPEDIAPFVLLPGDPDRAEHIALTHLDGARRYTGYRRMVGYTGRYGGVPVSVQSTGMGCPSAAIVVEELVQLGARGFIRLGTCGGLYPEAAHGDLIVASAASAIDMTPRALVGIDGFAPTASFSVVHAAVEVARAKGIEPVVGPVATCDLFYDPRSELFATLRRYGTLALEMETAVILTIAAREGALAGSLLVVSDIVASEARASDEAILRGVDSMTSVALETVVSLST